MSELHLFCPACGELAAAYAGRVVVNGDEYVAERCLDCKCLFLVDPDSGDLLNILRDALHHDAPLDEVSS